MSSDRMVPAEVSEALDRLRADVLSPVYQWSRPIEVYFPAATVRVPVAHGLGSIPQGYTVWLTVGGEVRAADVVDWTHDVAYLVATVDHTRARLQFVLLREEVRNDA